MNICILLPYKENFVSNKAGAVSLFVNDITKNSIYQKTTKIFGNTIYKKKFKDKNLAMSFEYKLKNNRLLRAKILKKSIL